MWQRGMKLNIPIGKSAHDNLPTGPNRSRNRDTDRTDTHSYARSLQNGDPPPMWIHLCNL